MDTLQRLRAFELQDWLAAQPAEVRVLSIDCFDTLVWRGVGRPTDVFFALQEALSWRRHGIRAAQRVRAEQQARARQRVLHGRGEVTIDEIYETLLPHASAEERARCIDEELRAEIEHAYLFAPVLELVRDAWRRGMEVMVVSDTYWRREQLGALLAGLAGDDGLGRLRVHCSCEHGVSKAGGLWPRVLAAECLAPSRVVHLGDHDVADGVAPRRFGLRSAQLVHHDAQTTDLLHHYANGASQIMPELRHERPLPSLFHGLLAAWDERGASVPQRIGYRSMGPIMYAFARYLETRVQALRAEGRTVRLAFLMRDGYLPMRALAALCPGEPVAELRISRFTARAASLHTREDVVDLLAEGIDEQHADVLLRQLLFIGDEAAAILAQAARGGNLAQSLPRQLLREDRWRTACARSAALRQRLYAHVRAQTGVRSGETLVLVDLGYSGTVQTRLRRAFRQELGVELRGLYLLAAAAQVDMSDRDGLIDPTWADGRMISALTAHVGLFEMMCARAEPSVVDYMADGQPVWGSAGTQGRQAALAAEIQDACVAFVRDAACVAPPCRPREALPALARQAAGELCRLTFFAQPEEVACLSSFEFDVNLGSDLVLTTADAQAGAREYRREGFALMNRRIDELRVSYPMEMRHLDLSLATTLLSARRYGYAIRADDTGYRTLDLPVLVADERAHALQTVTARSTFDGYYRAHLPHGRRFDLSVLLGEAFEWVQIDAVQRVALADARVLQELVVGEHVILDGAEPASAGLYHLTPTAMLFVPRAGDDAAMLRLVLRPVVHRSAG